jgi:hypothetical protein
MPRPPLNRVLVLRMSTPVASGFVTATPARPLFATTLLKTTVPPATTRMP